MGDVMISEQLKNLIEKSSISWTYSILWECSSQRRVLRFKDGYHRRSGKAKQVRIMGSGGTVAEDTAASEWFFKISMNQCFEINEDLPGHALIVPTAVWVNTEERDGDQTNPYKWEMWNRTKLAQQFGIGTVLCLPLQEKRVLELASTQIIPYYDSFQWIHNNSHLIHPIGTLTQQQQQKQQEVLFPIQQLQQLLQQEILFAIQQLQQLQQLQPEEVVFHIQKLIQALQHLQTLLQQQEFLFPIQYLQQLQQVLQLIQQQQQQQRIMAENELRRIRDDADELNEEAVNEMKNRGKEKINEMKNRGKEKISDSKCSWTILTESSDRGTNRTFSCSHDYSGPS